jgi:hypothetical protein
VLRSDLTIAINIGFSFAAMHYFSLAHGKKLVAICTLVQVVSFFFK